MEGGGWGSSSSSSSGMIVREEEQRYRRFPPGFWFRPTDKELIVDYLRRKVYNLSLPYNNNIFDLNIYNYSPAQLYATYKIEGEAAMYFFTPLGRKYPKGNRPRRAAGDGHWKTTATKKHIGNKENPIGFKRALVFYRGPFKTATKTDWLMLEYSLPENTTAASASTSSRPPNNMELDTWVLSKIYKKSTKSEATDGICSDSPEMIPSTSSSSAPLQTLAPVLQTNDVHVHQPQLVPYNENLSPDVQDDNFMFGLSDLVPLELSFTNDFNVQQPHRLSDYFCPMFDTTMPPLFDNQVLGTDDTTSSRQGCETEARDGAAGAISSSELK